MRTLYLIRHAKSSWDVPGQRDFDRALNDRGLKDAPRMADLLLKRGVKAELIVSSPAKRAFTTACFFAKEMGLEESEIFKKPEIYEAYPTTILQIISALPDSAHTVLMFGHNPTFTEVANRFSEDFIDNVPTCGIVQIASKAETWAEMSELNSRVVACFFPKQFF